MIGRTLLALCLAMASAGAAFGMTADEIIAKHIAAIGGLEKIHAVKSIKFTGKLRPAGFPADLVFVETIQRPASVRVEASLQGFTSINAYDGKQAWQVQPFRGRKDPERMSADDAKELDETAEFEGPLVDYKTKGHSVDYLGTEEVDGTLAHKFRVKRKNGDVDLVYLDPDAFLTIRVVTRAMRHGTEVESETDFSDYEEVAGLMLPFSQISGEKGAQRKQSVTFDKAEANIALDAKIFSFPETGGAK